MPSLIEFRGVGKRYTRPFASDVVALEDVSLDVHAGEVLGIAGPNGAGKSTLISILLGYVPPSRGEVRIANRPVREYIERHGVGYLSELVDVDPRGHWLDALLREEPRAPRTMRARRRMDVRHATLASMRRLHHHPYRRSAGADAAEPVEPPVEPPVDVPVPVDATKD